MELETVLHWHASESLVYRNMTRPLRSWEAARVAETYTLAGLHPQRLSLAALAAEGLPYTYIASVADVADDAAVLGPYGWVTGGVRVECEGRAVVRLTRSAEGLQPLWRATSANGDGVLLSGGDLVHVTRDWRGVVHVSYAPFDVYIGRAVPRRGLAASPWASPFKVGRDGDHALVVNRYRAWLLTRPDLMARLGELRGKTLGCWCKVPGAEKPCHGDVLADLAKGAGL